ncbi:MAG: tRNA pseudouridine(38-40) synthase TruA [Geminicoccaceae bacterium]|jgi:tRNA pseudouridine38-40 synthase|nr:tRNA pseudouridine(38-40) synthase TruA [Geminicoccaceae bacterium]HRY25565.1 tRNA pseudouridine(38-40) synthase TruA [Geminicoccaceae bacterium]
MPRYRLLLEFDGGPFCGWQIQANGPSVQAALEAAADRMVRRMGPAVAAGRTDAGVHALALPVQLDLEQTIMPERLMSGLNHHLRHLPIVVLWASLAQDGFHVRFNATARHYRYRILARRAPPALEHGRVWHVARSLDAERMQAAAETLVGRHDFTSFRDSACQAASPVKTLGRLWVERHGPLIEIGACAPSFLHHQVRNLVGTLKVIGEGSKPVAFAAAALAARSRAAAGPTAPAEGLYFVAADYPGEPGLAGRQSKKTP